MRTYNTRFPVVTLVLPVLWLLRLPALSFPAPYDSGTRLCVDQEESANTSDSQTRPAVLRNAQQPSGTVGFAKWWTVSGHSDSGYRRTQFFEPHYDTTVFQWDSRMELWLPPFYRRFSWGPYLHVSVIDSNRTQAWENGWLAGPGVGFQVYPFSSARFVGNHQSLARVLTPVRLFGEYNRLNYWGEENQWRPRAQARVGLEYWRAVNVNNPSRALWTEVWTGLIWHSANEFDTKYDTVILGSVLRLGARVPQAKLLSWFSPYVLLDSSFSENDDYFWENRLRVGGGSRCSPPIPAGWQETLNRLVVYAEYIDATTYYHESVQPAVPNHDFRVGMSFSIGEWFRKN